MKWRKDTYSTESMGSIYHVRKYQDDPAIYDDIIKPGVAALIHGALTSFAYAAGAAGNDPITGAGAAVVTFAVSGWFLSLTNGGPSDGESQEAKSVRYKSCIAGFIGGAFLTAMATSNLN